MRAAILCLLSLSFSLLSGCKNEQVATVSCSKPSAGICTEHEGVTAATRARLAGSQCVGGTLTDARCPTEDIVGQCKRTLLLEGPIQTVDFYYRPIKPPHTKETLQTICSELRGTWTPGSGSGVPTSSAPGSGSGAPGSEKPGRIETSVGECQFSLEAPERLKPEPSMSTPTSVSFASPSFAFMGFSEMPLEGLEMMELHHTGPGPILYKGTEKGVSLLITRDPKSSDMSAITGKGEEVQVSGREKGCTFNCTGVKEREAEVVQMCKSVRIKLKAR